MEVKIYTTPTCGYCHQAKSFLNELGVDYAEIDVSRDRAAAEEMASLTGQMGVPVITVDGQTVIGFDRARLQQLLAGAGRRERPRFGLKVADASRIAQKTGTVPVFGALIGAVAAASPGERAGLRAGDIITEINLRRVSNAADLEKALGGLESGGLVSIIFLRNGQTRKSEIFI